MSEVQAVRIADGILDFAERIYLLKKDAEEESNPSNLLPNLGLGTVPEPVPENPPVDASISPVEESESVPEATAPATEEIAVIRPTNVLTRDAVFSFKPYGV